MSRIHFHFLVEFFLEIFRNHFSVLVCNIFKNESVAGISQLFCLYLKNMNHEYVASHVKDQSSSNINEVIRAVSNFLYFFHNKISQVQKSAKRYRDNSVF